MATRRGLLPRMSKEYQIVQETNPAQNQEKTVLPRSALWAVTRSLKTTSRKKKTETQKKMSNKLQKVERGGEVQPDNRDKGSDADVKRHKYGIPESASRKAPASEQEEHEGATEDQVTDTPAPAGPLYDDEPKQG